MTGETTTSSSQSPYSSLAAGAGRTRSAGLFRFPTLGRLLRAVLPDEAVQHLYAARRERLLAARAVIDAALERLERAQSESRRR